MEKIDAPHSMDLELVHLNVQSTSFIYCFRLSTSLAIYSNVINVNDECAAVT